MSSDPEFHHIIRLADIPPAGRHLVLKVGDADRARIAEAFDLVSIAALDANLHMAPRSNGDVDVRGTVDARVTYRCVVSLEPFDGEVHEELQALFSDKLPTEFPEELEVTEDMPDLPEPVVNGTIDVGRLVAEFLALGLETYPRKPEASLDPALSAPDPSLHPFAALARLKTGE